MTGEIDNPQTSHPQGLARMVYPEALEDHVLLEAFPEEIPHLRDYWAVVIKRRWVVLCCLLGVFSVTAIGTLKEKPIYQGRALLEIRPEPTNFLNLKEILQVGETTDVETYRQTQIKVLQSRTLAEHVVDSLRLCGDPNFNRRRILFGLIEIPAKAPSSRDSGPVKASSAACSGAVKLFQGSLEVKPVLRSSLVELLFESPDPELAAHAANQLSSDYIEFNLQSKWDEAAKASEWLERQLVGVKGKLEKSEDNLQAYAQANSIFFVTDKENLVSVRLAELQAEYTRAQSERIQKESLARVIQAGKPEDFPGALSDRMVSSMEERLADLRREYAKVTTSVKPEYPGAVQIQKQMESVEASLARQKKLLAQNVINEYRAALEREKALAEAIEEQRKEASAVAEKSIQYNIQKRDVDSNRALYDALLQHLKESQVTRGLSSSNIRVVEAAEVPRGPIKPRVLLNLALGIILGFGLGIGLAFFQEYLDNTLKTTDEVEKFLRLPALGVLPAFSANGAGKSALEKQPSRGAGEEQPGIQTSPTTVEAYRSLRTSILLSAHPVPKLFLITSALPGEGKTTTAVNLGAILASLGSKVVIVDCDMRRPACHRTTRVENKPGFVQCLTNQVELAEAILPVPGVANLSVIPCGPIPPNPGEILSSPLTAELLQRLRREFEYVLVDSPPLLSVADSRVLATMTDAVALVVRAHSTPYQAVRRARALLQEAGARILGVALNDVDIRRDGYSYSYYYRYGYGYGYGPGDQSEHDAQGEGLKDAK